MTTTPPKIGTETPWGAADSVKEIIPGVWKVGTSGHGGILVDSLRMEKIPEKFQSKWFEEDQAWSIPYCIFAKELPAEDIYHAFKTITRDFPEFPKEHIAEAAKICTRWEEENKQRYMHGSFSFHGSDGTEIQRFNPVDKSLPDVIAQRKRKSWDDTFRFPQLPTLQELQALVEQGVTIQIQPLSA